MKRDRSITLKRHRRDMEAMDPGPRASLLVYHGPQVDVVPLAPGASLVVGRVPEADISIPAPPLSRHHARLDVLGAEVWVEDLDSSNGTHLNGERITRCKLAPGDQLTLGGVTLALHIAATFSQGLEPHRQFLAMLGEELIRAQSFGHAFSLLLVREARPSVFAEWSTQVKQLLRPVDRVGQHSVGTLEILMPETEAAAARKVADRIVAATSGRLRCGVSSFPQDGKAADVLLDACDLRLRDATGEHPVVSTISHPDELLHPSREYDSPLSQMVVGHTMRPLLDTVRRVATSHIPVLFCGETGTGKEVLAQVLHKASDRGQHEMITLNCGAIPKELVSSVLFGHERGTFTGAHRQSKGVFEVAHGSTLLLDEVGELPSSAQVALLRVLETHTLTRLGATKPIPIDVRVVSATHRDLELLVETGHFRRDLLFRLNTVTVKVPPLRQRTDEIEDLALQFLDQACRTSNKALKRLDEEAMALLKRFQWPGNVRELRNAMERAVLVSGSQLVCAADLPERVRASSAVIASSSPMVRASDPTPYPHLPRVQGADKLAERRNFKDRVRDYEAILLRRSLERVGWNKTRAAELLRMPLRTLMHKLQTLKLDTPQRSDETVPGTPRMSEADKSFRDSIQDYETRLISRALQKASGNRAHTARNLGLPLSTLLYKIKAYGL